MCYVYNIIHAYMYAKIIIEEKYAIRLRGSGKKTFEGTWKGLEGGKERNFKNFK